MWRFRTICLSFSRSLTWNRLWNLRNMATTSTCSQPSPFTLGSFDAFGFDIDMTLSVNNIPRVFRVVHEAMTKYLVEVKGYDKDILESFDVHHDFCTRSIVFDCRKGNFLKLGKDGTILRASHGTQFLNADEIKSEYKDGRIQDVGNELIKSWDNIVGRCMVYDNYYDMIGSVAMARMVDVTDKKKGRKLDDYLFIWDDVIGAYTNTYLYTMFRANKGGFFPAIKQNPEKFLYPCNEKVKTWLKHLKEQGKVLFLLTSSFGDFAQMNINHLFGPNWREIFDLMLVHAKKPSFFYADSSRPFLKLEDNMEGKPAEVLETGGIYTQGNVGTLTSYLSRKLGKSNPQVLYFGDSMRSDIFAAKKFAHWCTVMVLEEIEAEIPEICLGSEELKDKENVPERDLFLSSSSWGSILVDHTALPPGDKGDINTLYGHLVCKYADIAVPSLVTVAEFDNDKEIQTFDHERFARTGFHPKKPRVLT